MAAEPSSAPRPKRTASSSADVVDDDTYRDAPSGNNKRAHLDNDAEEAMTRDEIEGAELPPTEPESASSQPSTKPRNAFSELMKPKPAKPKSATEQPPHHHHHKKSSSFRDNLGIYIANPASPSFSSQIIFHTDAFVAIRDLYPKATVHCLLLPRASAVNRLHPFDALSSSASFLASVREEAARLKALVAKELQRRLGRFSASEADRNAFLDGDTTLTTTTTTTTKAEEGKDATTTAGDDDDDDAIVPPTGRDWSRDVLVGVHAVPSMNHLHVHVLSRDLRSDRLRHRKHYNSFTTDFFVPLDAFPLAADDWRRGAGAQRRWPERPMVCWRCGRDFGSRFKELKAHLEEEFEEWKRE